MVALGPSVAFLFFLRRLRSRKDNFLLVETSCFSFVGMVVKRNFKDKTNSGESLLPRSVHNTEFEVCWVRLAMPEKETEIVVRKAGRD